MTQDEAFLSAIAESPDDDALRLIYADWLQDHGDPRRSTGTPESSPSARTSRGWALSRWRAPAPSFALSWVHRA